MITLTLAFLDALFAAELNKAVDRVHPIRVLLIIALGNILASLVNPFALVDPLAVNIGGLSQVL